MCKGRFGQADVSTLFLDEIGKISTAQRWVLNITENVVKLCNEP
ncbi:MAG: hypothetical protein HRT83_05090 [Hyphomicrobiaceae bacterium]|nr:hypothetical protein [Hyphomicrobiaceae bacterium]